MADKDKAKAALAEIFMEQCIGESAGHMSMIPNNPTMSSICNVMMGPRDKTRSDKERFRDMLQDLADNLDTNPAF